MGASILYSYINPYKSFNLVLIDTDGLIYYSLCCMYTTKINKADIGELVVAEDSEPVEDTEPAVAETDLTQS